MSLPIRYSRLVLFLPLLFIFTYSAGQISNPEAYIQSLGRADSLLPKEKVFLHFDKDSYHPGETLWFTAYLTWNGQAGTDSHNLYAELLNESGQVVQKKIFRINFCIAQGQFSGTDSLPEGFYTVRAYTAWMRNFTEAALFHKTIPLFAQKEARRIRQGEGDVAKAGFYPEGGHLLTGVSNKMVFYCTNEQGLPVAAEGKVVDETGMLVFGIRSFRDGYGSFRLRARPDKQYFAELNLKNGQTKKFPLPANEKNGVALEIEPAEGGINGIINKSGNDPDNDNLTLLVAKNNVVLMQAELSLRGGNRSKGFIPLDGLQEGLAVVYLFNGKMNPVSQRIIYVPPRGGTPQIDSLKTGAGVRGQVSFQLQFTDSLPLVYSVSVTDAERDGRDPMQADMRYAFLVQSSIGDPTGPNLRFADEENKGQESLLDMMLIAESNKPGAVGEFINKQFDIDTSFVSRFRVLTAATSHLNKNLELIINTGQDEQGTYSAFVNGNGEFSINGVEFYDSLSIYHKFNFPEGTAYRVQQIPDRWLALNENISFPQPPGSLYSLAEAALPPAGPPPNSGKTGIGDNKQLATVSVKSTREKMRETDERYSTGLFRGLGNCFAFDLINDPPQRGSSLWTYLIAHVPGLKVDRVVRFRDFDTSTVRLTARPDGPGRPVPGIGQSPGQNTDKTGMYYLRSGARFAFYIDETELPIDDVDKYGVGILHKTLLDDIAYVKVFNPPFSGASFGDARGGAVVVYTRRGGEKKSGPFQGLSRFSARGYDKPQVFPSPDYSTGAKDNPGTDNRITLLWEPRLQPDAATGRAKLSFFKNDYVRKLRIVVEGINRFGIPVRMEKVIDANQ